jgi:molecular chaperone GrpE
MIPGFQGVGLPPEPAADGEPSVADEWQPSAEPAGVPARQAAEAAGPGPAAGPQTAEPLDQTAALLITVSENVERLATSAEHYHARAEQREGVIDHLHSEVDMLRRGERRGLLRPLLVEMCRLRNDLLRQAEDLPGDFDADRARLLLRSYAESVELALEDSGVATFAPERGDPFQPRLHRRVGGEPADDSDVAGCVARVRRAGYLDIEANTPIVPAEVVLFVPGSAGLAESPAPPPERSDQGERARHEHGPASASRERKES